MANFDPMIVEQCLARRFGQRLPYDRSRWSRGTAQTHFIRHHRDASTVPAKDVVAARSAHLDSTRAAAATRYHDDLFVENEVHRGRMPRTGVPSFHIAA